MLLKFWDEAFLTATYLINMLPSKVIHNDTHVHHLLGTQPDYKSLRVFGCACWPNLRPYNQRKLAFRSKQCVFLGYSPRHKGVKCLEVATGRVYASRDVVFDDAVFPFQNLHPNVGALLRNEILLLDPSLLNFEQGGDNTNDSHVANFPTNPAPSSPCCAPQETTGHQLTAGENLAPNGAPMAENSAHEILTDEDESAEHGADFLTDSASSSDQAPSDHAPSVSDHAPHASPAASHSSRARGVHARSSRATAPAGSSARGFPA
jgi:hypothetical protein